MSDSRTSDGALAAQRLRVELVIDACRRLASEGGYESVQMREVAKMAGVSLHSIYRYYASKDKLIQAMVQLEMHKLREDVVQRPPQQKTVAGRVGAVFLRAFQMMLSDRGFAHAAMHSSYYVPKPLTTQIPSPDLDYDPNEFPEIAALAAWGPGHRLTEEQYTSLLVAESLLNSCVVSLLNGQLAAEHAVQRLTFAIERLLPGECTSEGSMRCVAPFSVGGDSFSTTTADKANLCDNVAALPWGRGQELFDAHVDSVMDGVEPRVKAVARERLPRAEPNSQPPSD
ncbi:TetR family transcriptional regulator [Rhodococcus erythropolis]|nr:TetR family transcriptional regulator [Rhodococcus erythropolis]